MLGRCIKYKTNFVILMWTINVLVLLRCEDCMPTAGTHRVLQLLSLKTEAAGSFPMNWSRSVSGGRFTSQRCHCKRRAFHTEDQLLDPLGHHSPPSSFASQTKRDPWQPRTGPRSRSTSSAASPTASSPPTTWLHE